MKTCLFIIYRCNIDVITDSSGATHAQMVVNGDSYVDDRVAKRFGENIVLGTVVDFGDATLDNRTFPAWKVKFDKKVVVYKEGGRGFLEDLDVVEFEDALGVRSDKNQRNFENFAQIFSPLGHIRTLLSPEREKIFGARVALRDTPCMWEGYETTVALFIFDRSARKWISVMGPNGGIPLLVI